jgi:glycopeptide antibiotics resistance protein
MGFILQFTDKFEVALSLWPLASLALTLPILAFLYHRDGRLRVVSAAAAYLSVLYALSLVCFTLYPLPSGTSGLGITYGIAPQLDPFAFVGDIQKDCLRAIFQDVANVAFFVPMGIIFHSGLRRNLPWTLALGFSVSLLIEVAQLTGLFHLYPYAYRTFDVDDLVWNTLGALVGWELAVLAGRLLPHRAPARVSITRDPGFTRRLVAFGLDMCFVLGISLAVFVVARAAAYRLDVAAPLAMSAAGALALILSLAFVLVEGVVPWLHDGSTPSGAFVRMTCETTKRRGGRRLAFYLARMGTLLASALLAPVALPLLGVFWASHRRMPYDAV